VNAVKTLHPDGCSSRNLTRKRTLISTQNRRQEKLPGGCIQLITLILLGYGPQRSIPASGIKVVFQVKNSREMRVFFCSGGVRDGA
jgi:hypothetical protein